MGSEVSTDHNRALMTPHTHSNASWRLFIVIIPVFPSASLLPSLPPSVPAGQLSALPLYKRLLFKTLRSDLVPTEAIPLAALCIYHGSPALSRLLTPQFSCLHPPFFHFLFYRSNTHRLISELSSSF